MAEIQVLDFCCVLVNMQVEFLIGNNNVQSNVLTVGVRLFIAIKLSIHLHLYAKAYCNLFVEDQSLIKESL